MNRPRLQDRPGTQVVLLGPQRFRPTLAPALDRLGVAGPVAVVTAGWQEREHEVDELREHLDLELINLSLYRRYEEVLGQDPELAEALRERQERLYELQRLYRVRLGHALDAARELMERPGRSSVLERHRRAAIRAVRTLDRQHLVQLREIHAEFDAAWRPSARPVVAGHRAELSEALERSTAVVVAGGHVAVLLYRLRLFDLRPLTGARPWIAWSAGAMALSERVVLFHDSPPQGPGNAEVLESGLAACPGIVALPRARRRLRLNDPVRVSLFARRFSPATCVLLERDAHVAWDGETRRASRSTFALNRRGGLSRMGRR